MRFAVGDVVRVTVDSGTGHNRAPRYTHGRAGRVVGCLGAFPLADEAATGRPDPRHDTLYTVRFEARGLWGTDGRDADAVHVDLFDSYLTAVREQTRED